MNNDTSKPNNYGLSIASLVLGITSILLSPFVIGIILGILAVIFGAISVKSNKGKSLAGIITGSFGIILTILFLILAFIALPSLQASQRDLQRKNDVVVLASDVIYYTGNNKGQLPDIEWVSDMAYKLDIVSSATSGQPTDESAAYVVGEDCDGVKSARNFAITILLENGLKYCQDS